MAGKKSAIIIITEGTEETELVAPVDLMRRAEVSLYSYFMIWIFHNVYLRKKSILWRFLFLLMIQNILDWCYNCGCRWYW